MAKSKGKKEEAWNWQAMESKYGPESDVSSAYDILSHYAYSSEDDAKSVGKISVASKGRSKAAPRRSKTYQEPTAKAKRVRIAPTPRKQTFIGEQWVSYKIVFPVAIKVWSAY